MMSDDLDKIFGDFNDLDGEKKSEEIKPTPKPKRTYKRRTNAEIAKDKQEKEERLPRKNKEYTLDGRLKRPANRIPVDSEGKRLVPGNAPKYTDPQDMLDKVNEYFTSGFERKMIIMGRGQNRKEVEVKVFSIIGLSLYLGFASRVSLLAYAKKSLEYFDVVAYGKSMISRHYEGLLQAGVSPSGMIFMLANIDGMVMQQDVGLEMQKPIQSITFTRRTINNDVKIVTADVLKKLPYTEKAITITPKSQNEKSVERMINKHKNPEKPSMGNILGIEKKD